MGGINTRFLSGWSSSSFPFGTAMGGDGVDGATSTSEAARINASIMVKCLKFEVLPAGRILLRTEKGWGSPVEVHRHLSEEIPVEMFRGQSNLRVAAMS